MNTVLRYLLTPSSILPASIYAQLSASCLLMYWNTETPHTAFPGKMKSGNVAGSAWEWLTFLFSIWQEVSPLGIKMSRPHTTWRGHQTFPGGSGFPNSGGNLTLNHLQKAQKALPCWHSFLITRGYFRKSADNVTVIKRASEMTG